MGGEPLRSVVVQCSSHQEVQCVLAAQQLTAAERDYVFVDPLPDQASAASTGVRAPGGLESFCRRATEFVARHERTSKSSFAPERRRLQVRFALLGAGALLAGAGGPLLGPAITKQLKAGTLAPWLVVSLFAVPVLAYTLRLSKLSLPDIEFYFRAAFLPQRLVQAGPSQELPGDEGQQSLLLRFLLGELEACLASGSHIVLAHAFDANTEREAPYGAKIVDAARRLGMPMTLVVAAEPVPPEPDATRPRMPAIPGVMLEESPYADCEGIEDAEIHFLGLRFPDAVAWLSEFVPRARAMPFVQGRRVTLNDLVTFLDDERRSKLTTLFSQGSSSFVEQAEHLWRSHRHAAIKEEIIGKDSRYDVFCREFVWLHGAFPGQPLESAALLKYWPPAGRPQPNDKAFQRMLVRLRQWPILRDHTGVLRSLHEDLDPHEIREVTLGEASVLPDYLCRAYWSMLESACAGCESAPNDGVLESLRLVDDVLRRSDQATLSWLRAQPEIGPRILDCTYEAALMSERGLLGESQGDPPLVEARRWLKRGLHLADKLSRRSGAERFSVDTAKKALDRLRCWCGATTEEVPVNVDTAHHLLWNAFLRGDLDGFCDSTIRAWRHADHGLVADAPWLQMASHLLTTALQYEWAGGWTTGVVSLRRDFDVVAARETVVRALEEASFPPLLHNLAYHLLAALQAEKPVAEPEQREGLLDAWAEYLEAHSVQDDHPVQQGFWLLNTARVAFWRRRNTGLPIDLRSGDDQEQTEALLSQAEAILRDQFRIPPAMHELAVDRCHVQQFAIAPLLSPATAQIQHAEHALQRSKDTGFTSGRTRIYSVLLGHYLSYSVPRSIELLDDAISFVEAAGFLPSVSLQLQRARSTVLFNASRHERFLAEEPAIIAALEAELADPTSAPEELREARMALAKSCLDMQLALEHVGRRGAQHLDLESVEHYRARAEACIAELPPDDEETLVLKAICARQGPSPGAPSQVLQKANEALELFTTMDAGTVDSKGFFEYAQTLVVWNEAYGKSRWLRADSDSNRTKHEEIVLPRIRLLYDNMTWRVLSGGWKYLRARMAMVLANDEPRVTFDWPDEGLERDVQDAFAQIATADARIDLLEDAFRQYCELEEFGRAVEAARMLRLLYEQFPELAPEDADWDAVEAICRRLVENPRGDVRTNDLHHATHVLYSRLMGVPFFENEREQFYAEAMDLLQQGHDALAYERFRVIVDACKRNVGKPIYDHDHDAFHRVAHYLRMKGDPFGAGEIDQLLGKLVGAAACTAFLLMAQNLIEAGKKHHADTYLDWVRHRGEPKQRGEAEKLM